MLAIYALFFALALFATRTKARYGLALMLVLDPFDVARHVSLTTVTVPKVVLAGVALGLIGRGAARQTLATAPVRTLLYAGAAVAVATALTAIPGLYIDAVVRETLKSLEYVAIFAVAALAYAADPDERTVWLSLTAVVAVVTVLALAQEATGAPSAAYIAGRIVPRIAGPLEGPNQLAGYFDIAIPMLLARLMVRRSWLVAGALAFAVLADVLTLSRAGALGLVVGALAVTARVADRRVRPALLWGFGGVAVAGVLVLAKIGALGRLFAVQDVDYRSGLGTRAELWSAALTFFRTHPILGIGAGNFEFELATLGFIGVRTHANSLYLQALAEGGILLFAAVVAALVLAIRLLYFARERDAFALGAGAATLALATHQLLDDMTFFPKVGGFWWMCLGIAAASLVVRRRLGQTA